MVSRKQTRRTISLNGDLYEKIQDRAAELGVSMSALVSMFATDGLGIEHPGRPFNYPKWMTEDDREHLRKLRTIRTQK